jgi:hypothetical protein
MKAPTRFVAWVSGFSEVIVGTERSESESKETQGKNLDSGVRRNDENKQRLRQ